MTEERSGITDEDQASYTVVIVLVLFITVVGVVFFISVFGNAVYRLLTGPVGPDRRALVQAYPHQIQTEPQHEPPTRTAIHTTEAEGAQQGPPPSSLYPEPSQPSQPSLYPEPVSGYPRRVQFDNSALVQRYSNLPRPNEPDRSTSYYATLEDKTRTSKRQTRTSKRQKYRNTRAY